MSTPQATCQNCDSPLATDALGSICPACLVGEALDSVDTVDSGVDSAFPDDRDARIPLGPAPLEGGTLGIGDRYKILQRIGEGGFGVVYMAEQSAPVRRRVALKILKAGMDTRQLLARFEAERQALAMMDHPNIAKVLDGGETDQGRPFFVMELVRGTPITDFCNREKLSPENRLKLFMLVCRAVQHAHQKGIIHRDLKPSNILITMPDGAEPVPKVIDFGVAKAMENNLTDKTLFTRFEQMIGTPAYMSPEQAGAEGTQHIDTRADIYALGVLLYELLSGTTPFESKKIQSAAFDEVRRILREDEVPRPSAQLSSLAVERRATIARERNTEANWLRKHLRGDLDWIVMKAIEKDRRRRYDTATSLCEDVERFLCNEPVLAGPPGLGYKAGKFVRRNRRAVAAAAFVFAALVVGITLAIWGMVRAKEAEEEVTGNLAELKTAYEDLDYANTATEKARQESQTQLVHRLLERGTEKFNEGEATALITLQEAVTAAEGAPELQQKAMEFWSLARSWLPGRVEKIIDQPLAFALSNDESGMCWLDKNGLHFYSIPTSEHRSHTLSQNYRVEPGPWAMRFSHDDRRVALFNPDQGVVQIWDVERQHPTSDLMKHPDLGLTHFRRAGAWTMVFDPTGRFIATIAYNGTACLWDVNEGKLATKPWKMDAPEISRWYWNRLAFSPTGKKLVLSTIGLFRVVDLEDDRFSTREIINYHQDDNWFVSGWVSTLLVPDEANFVAGAPTTLQRWNIESGEIEGTLEVPFMNIRSHLFEDTNLSPDGRIIAAGLSNGDARLCGANSLAQIGEPLKHGGRVSALRFSGNNLVLTSGSESLQIWSQQNPWHRLGIWSQFKGSQIPPSTGVVGERVVSYSGLNGFERAILRSLPQRNWHRVFGTLPGAGTLMDILNDGQQMLVLSSDRRVLSVWNSNGVEIRLGPRIDEPMEQIRHARFVPGGREIVYEIARSGQGADAGGQEYRLWRPSDEGRGALIYGHSTGGANAKLGCVLPTSPPAIVVNSLGWNFKVFELPSAQLLGGIDLDNQAASAVVNLKRGWYGVGDRSGNFRRFSLENHEELPPSLRLGGNLVCCAVSGDGLWLLAVLRDSNGVQLIRAFYLAGEAPYYGVQMHLPTYPEKMHIDAQVFPVGPRGFLFQAGQELRRFDLPQGGVNPDLVSPLTDAVLGVKQDENGLAEYRMLTAEEHRQALVVESEIWADKAAR